MQNQKAIAHILNRHAERANYVGARPASQKQIWFLAGLIEKSGDDLAREWGFGAANTNAILTSAKAAMMIGSYLNV